MRPQCVLQVGHLGQQLRSTAQQAVVVCSTALKCGAMHLAAGQCLSVGAHTCVPDYEYEYAHDLVGAHTCAPDYEYEYEYEY